MLSERLILKRVESSVSASFGLHNSFVEFDDGEFFVFAYIELVYELIVDFHEFLLQNGDLFFVMAALFPL